MDNLTDNSQPPFTSFTSDPGFGETTVTSSSRLSTSPITKHPVAVFLEVYYSLFLIIFGTIGNLLSLAVLSRKAFRSSPLGVCLGFLALADLTALYTGPLYFTALELFNYNFRKVNVASCKFHRWASYSAVDLSAWTLVVVTTARLTSVIWPMKEIFTRRSAFITLFITLVVIVGINSPTFFMYGTVRLPHRTLLCKATTKSYRYFTDYIWSWMVLVKISILPGTILLVMNIMLVVRVVRSRQRLDELSGDRPPMTISSISRAKITVDRWLVRRRSSRDNIKKRKYQVRQCESSDDIERQYTCVAEKLGSVQEEDSVPVDNGEVRGIVSEHQSSTVLENDLKRGEHNDTSGNNSLFCESHENGAPSDQSNCLSQAFSEEGLPGDNISAAPFPKTFLRSQMPRKSFPLPRTIHKSRSFNLKSSVESKDEIDRVFDMHGKEETSFNATTCKQDTKTSSVKGTSKDKYRNQCQNELLLAVPTEGNSQDLSSFSGEKTQNIKVLGQKKDNKSSSQRIASDSETDWINYPSPMTSHNTHQQVGLPVNQTNLRCHESDPESTRSQNGLRSSNDYILKSLSFEHIKALGVISPLFNMSSEPALAVFQNNAETRKPVKSAENDDNNNNNNNDNSSNVDDSYDKTITTDKGTPEVDTKLIKSTLINPDPEPHCNATFLKQNHWSDESTSVSAQQKQLSTIKPSESTESLNHAMVSHIKPPGACINYHTKPICCSNTRKPSYADSNIHDENRSLRNGRLGLSIIEKFRRRPCEHRRQTKRRNLTLTVIVFNAMFILCNLPIVIYMAGRVYMFTGKKRPNSPQYVMEICANYFMYTNNATNFILYCITGSRFREELKNMFCQLWSLVYRCFQRKKKI